MAGVPVDARCDDRSAEHVARRFTYDAVTYEPRTLRSLVDVVGADRVVLGTD